MDIETWRRQGRPLWRHTTPNIEHGKQGRPRNECLRQGQEFERPAMVVNPINHPEPRARHNSPCAQVDRAASDEWNGKLHPPACGGRGTRANGAAAARGNPDQPPIALRFAGTDMTAKSRRVEVRKTSLSSTVPRENVGQVEAKNTPAPITGSRNCWWGGCRLSLRRPHHVKDQYGKAITNPDACSDEQGARLRVAVRPTRRGATRIRATVPLRKLLIDERSGQTFLWRGRSSRASRKLTAM